MKKKGSAAGDDSDEDESDTKSLLGRSALGKSDKILNLSKPKIYMHFYLNNI